MRIWPVAQSSLAQKKPAHATPAHAESRALAHMHTLGDDRLPYDRERLQPHETTSDPRAIKATLAGSGTAFT